ncbi:hypothetical protein YC2023_107961 [Brassica napus]
MVVTGDGELGFDSGEGARETATTSKEGSKRANYPILTRGGIWCYEHVWIAINQEKKKRPIRPRLAQAKTTSKRREREPTSGEREAATSLERKGNPFLFPSRYDEPHIKLKLLTRRIHQCKPISDAPTLAKTIHGADLSSWNPNPSQQDFSIQIQILPRLAQAKTTSKRREREPTSGEREAATSLERKGNPFLFPSRLQSKSLNEDPLEGKSGASSRGNSSSNSGQLGARRRSDTVLVSTINDADQGSADVAFRTPLAPYEKSKFSGSGGSMVARLKLKGIDGRAPPGVEPAA